MSMNHICSVSGCDKPVKCIGYCNKHYLRHRRHGSISQTRAAPGEPLAWLHSHVGHRSSGCLIWPFSRNHYGYAQINHGGAPTGAHRLMCKLVHGDPPSINHQAAHSCGKGHEGCLNPMHLRWDTPSGNLADRVQHGTINRGRKNGRNILSEDSVRDIISLKGIIPQRKLAAIYGVSKGAIGSIHSGANWAWLD